MATPPRKGYRTCQGPCGKNRHERFFRGQRGKICGFCRKRKVSVANRETRIWETYGITLTEWDQMLAEQDGMCAICNRSPRYNLDVDHDHAMEKTLLEGGYAPMAARRMSIRGLLCKTCNRRLLPSVRDRVEWLEYAIDYLKQPPAFRVLEPQLGGPTPPHSHGVA